MKTKSFLRLVRPVVMTALGIIAPLTLAAENAPNWSQLSCGDAGYGGRPAFTCTTEGKSLPWDGETGAWVNLHVWATPNFNGRTSLWLGRKAKPRGSDKLLTDPIVLKVDGRIAREYKPADVIEYSGGGFPHVTLPLDEALVRELRSGEELRIEYTDGNGAVQSVSMPSLVGSRPVFNQLVERPVSEYRAYYGANNGKSSPKRGEKSESVPSELWGVLGETADRAPIWLNKGYSGRRMVEFKWLEHGKSLEIRTVVCEGDVCRDATWTVRANPQAVVDNKRTGALVLFNEANRPVFRFGKISDDGDMWFGTYDPILEADSSPADGISLIPRRFSRTKRPCCVQIAFDEFAPGSAQEAQRLFGEIAKEKQAKIAQAQAAEQARREEEERAALVAAEEAEEERNRPASPNLAQIFASTFASEMAKNKAQQGRVMTPANVYQQGSRVPRTASVPTQQPVRQATSSELAVPTVSVNRASSVAVGAGGESGHSFSEPPVSKLKETPEAIVACTKPSGPKGAFKCATPVNIQSGHLEDRSGYRTPEEFMNSNRESCPNARRLESTTHLVWGCGFGATNNYGYMDRSGGVDVRGRNTYYCYEKQTSCRRTSA